MRRLLAGLLCGALMLCAQLPRTSVGGGAAAGAGTGDVVGPAKSTTNHIPAFADETGKLLKDYLALVTSIGSPGADTSVPSEQAVREALTGLNTLTAAAIVGKGQLAVGADGARGMEASTLDGLVLLTKGVPSAAAAANIVGLWASGSCTGYLESDGTCDAITTHTQNTDTGTTGTTFAVDSDNTGPQLKNAAGTMEIRNAADDAYAPLKASSVSVVGAAGAAGFVGLTQGTACSPGSNEVCVYVPASVTAFGLLLPGAVGNTGVVKVAVSGSVATYSHAALLNTDLPANNRISSVGCNWGSTASGASALTTGTGSGVCYQIASFDCTITAWSAMVAPSGTVTFDVWKVAAGTALPTVSDALTGAGDTHPEVASGAVAESTTLTGWSSLTVTAGDIFGFNIDAVATATWAQIGIKCQR